MCVSVQSYRYVLINDVRTLERLNGCAITDAERRVKEWREDQAARAARRPPAAPAPGAP